MMFLYAIKMEIYAFCEFMIFARRHARYLTTAFFLYVYSLKSFKGAHRLRIGFAVLQHMDDVLDGDRKVAENPEVYVRQFLNNLESSAAKIENKSRFQELNGYFHKILIQLSGPDQHPVLDYKILLETLIRDYNRRIKREIYVSNELKEHHYKTFFHSVNLTLILIGSEKRANQEEEVVQALSWCSPIRDIQDDYQNGLINVPAEVLHEARTEKKELFLSDAYYSWDIEQFQQACKIFEEYDLKQDREPLVDYFMKALKAYLNKHRRLISLRAGA